MKSGADTSTEAYSPKPAKVPESAQIADPCPTLASDEPELTPSTADGDLVSSLSPDPASKVERSIKRSHEFSEYQRREILAGRGDELVIGNYVIQDLCGRGGEARVFRAFNVVLERIEAIKVVDMEGMDEEEIDRLRSRFSQGAAASAKLNHPNVVKTLSCGDGAILLAMEFVDGPDLGTKAGVDPTHNSRSTPIEIAEEDAIHWIKQAAAGLQHGHENDVIHRDVKPSNLLLDEEQNNMVRVADWGLARIDDDRTRITTPEHCLGSCYWKSPEQSLRPDEVDKRADIYSLGATLFSILTGTVMFTGETSVMVELAHVEQPIPRISDHRPVSQQLEQVFQKMVAKEPADRFQNMGAVIAALETCQIPVKAI